MLAPPGIRFLPEHAAANIVVNLVAMTSVGKTTCLRAAVSVYGPGRSVGAKKGTALRSWKTTGNAIENLLAAHSGVGICLDEMKQLDVKAAATVAYDIYSGTSKGRMNADSTTREGREWELFGFSSAERTLSDRAGEQQPGRRQPADAGGEARVINIPARDLFPERHGYASDKLFAEALATASTQHYGHALPAFVEFLINNLQEAAERIGENLEVWGALTASRLGPKASEQAQRICLHLGSAAAIAALAADLLNLPFSDVQLGDTPGIGRPGRSMMWSFLRTFEIWLDANGAEVSTMESEAFTQLRAYFLGAAPGAFAVTTVDGPVEEDHPSQSEAIHRRGFRVIESARFSNGKLEHGKLAYVDFLRDVLAQQMGWTTTTLNSVLRGLRNREFLVTSKPNILTYTRRINGLTSSVYRVKAAFFG
jgi:putative DNA primase/helicase